MRDNRSNQARYKAKNIAKVASALGGHRCSVPGCVVCDPLMIELDHINNDGAEDRRKHPTKYLSDLAKLCDTQEGLAALRARFQMLCASHNRQKETFRARGWEWSLDIASKRLKEFGMG